tara:strand:- start:18202 stop:18702 length:501 start_codon:yes stop_codon:yes gene_type:complete
LKLLGNYITLELIIAIILFSIPILLPSFYGGFLDSLSEYAHTDVGYLYGILLSLCGFLIIYDGASNNKRRWYNILIGLSLLGVVLFPVNFFLITHDLFAILFFIGNAFIVTYYSLLLSKNKKLIFSLVILITLMLLITGVFTLFIAEAIGLISMSYFMYVRHSLKK